MRLRRPIRISRADRVLRLPDGAGIDVVLEVLRRFDPSVRRKRRRLGTGIVLWGRDLHVRGGQDGLARGLKHHLGGHWLAPPPEPGEHDEPLNDLVRVFLKGELLPAQLATLLRPALPRVVIRENRRLGLFWFDDDDSDLTVSAWPAEPDTVPTVARTLGPQVYEVGIDDVHGPTARSAAQAWRLARLLERALGGVPVDRYGFRVTRTRDLLPGRATPA